LEVAIDEIDSLPADGQPHPAVDPPAPPVEVRHHRSGDVVDGLGQLADALDGEGGGFRVEDVEIEVRLRPGASSGVRSPEHHGLNPADGAEPLRERRHQFTLSRRELFHGYVLLTSRVTVRPPGGPRPTTSGPGPPPSRPSAAAARP